MPSSVQLSLTRKPASVPYERLPLGSGLYLASVYFHVTDPAWIWAIHVGILCAMLLFTVGYQTRITSVLTWLGALCYMERSPWERPVS